MNNDVELNKRILSVFQENKIGLKWVLDANASWDINTALSLKELIA
jgi:hypothetical protein